MKIGFDLDGIFIDTPPFVPKKIIEWLYRGHDHRLFYRFPSKPEQWVRDMTHIDLLRPAITENIEEIKQMRRRNTHRYYLVSSRFGFLKQRTKAMIKKYAFERIFDAMFFNFEDQQPHIFKNEIVQRLKLDRYVDDDLPLLRFLAEENPKTIFYWLNTKESKQIGETLFAITELSQMFE